MGSVPWIDDTLAGAAAPGMVKGLYSRNPWDTVTMGDVQFPGICTVNVTRSKRLDSKKAAGRDGATPTYLGDEPATIDITCTVWTRAQWDALQDVMALIWPSSQGAKNGENYNQALPLSHPALDCAPRVQFVTLTGHGKARPSGRGQIQITLRGLEYLPATTKNATKTVDKSPGAQVNPALRISTVGGGTVLARSENAQQPKPSTDTDFLGPLY